jgi:hypothetical protein
MKAEICILMNEDGLVAVIGGRDRLESVAEMDDLQKLNLEQKECFAFFI